MSSNEVEDYYEVLQVSDVALYVIEALFEDGVFGGHRHVRFRFFRRE